MFIELCFFLVSTSVAFVLIYVAITEFCAEFECFSQDLTEVFNSAANSTSFFTVSSSALYNCVADWEQPASPARADERSVPRSPNEQRGFVPLSVRLSNVALVMMRIARLFIPYFKLRNNLSLTECAVGWRHGMHLSSKSAENLQQLWKFASSCENCGVCLILR